MTELEIPKNCHLEPISFINEMNIVKFKISMWYCFCHIQIITMIAIVYASHQKKVQFCDLDWQNHDGFDCHGSFWFCWNECERRKIDTVRSLPTSHSRLLTSMWILIIMQIVFMYSYVLMGAKDTSWIANDICYDYDYYRSPLWLVQLSTERDATFFLSSFLYVSVTFSVFIFHSPTPFTRKIF